MKGRHKMETRSSRTRKNLELREQDTGPFYHDIWEVILQFVDDKTKLFTVSLISKSLRNILIYRKSVWTLPTRKVPPQLDAVLKLVTLPRQNILYPIRYLFIDLHFERYPHELRDHFRRNNKTCKDLFPKSIVAVDITYCEHAPQYITRRFKRKVEHVEDYFEDMAGYDGKIFKRCWF